jgi:hypothetical protein
MSFKTLIGRRVTKTVKFLDTNVEINKLSVAQVQDIQARVAALPKADAEGADGSDVGNAHLGLMIEVIKMSVVGAEEVTEDQFRDFPLEDLQKLSDEVLRHSGLGKDRGNAKP